MSAFLLDQVVSTGPGCASWVEGRSHLAGLFITFEGGEGAGKSTQAKRLAKRFRDEGLTVVLTREPGGSPQAERVRAALLTEAGRDLPGVEQAILFAAARADHVDTVIKPALADGSVVICDRFYDSTEAYQGAAGASPAMMDLLKTIAVGELIPDLTLVLDVPPETGLERARARNTLDAFENDDLAVHRARREAFLRIAAREPQRCAVVDASANEHAIADSIWSKVMERLDMASAA